VTILQNILGISNIRLANYPILSQFTLCCFFEDSGTQSLQPQAVITDFCDTWDLDGNSDIMPEVSPSISECWDIDANGDIMPEVI